MSYAHGPEGLTPDDLDRASRNSQIRDKALAWYRKAEPDIAALAGHEATAAEKAIAQLLLMIEIGAAMYGAVRKEFGEPTAQELLRQSFTVLGAVLRRNGEPIQMRVQVDFSKVGAQEASPPLCESRGDEKCDCVLDQDGRCDYCIETFRSFCSKMGESVRIVREADLSNRKCCRPCVKRHMDAAMAQFVRRDVAKLAKEDPGGAEAMMKGVFLGSQSLQAMPMPLTMKTWGEITK